MNDNQVLYDQIGSGYNATRQADPYITNLLFQFLSPEDEKLYLDIGCGTGNYAIALTNKGLKFYGVEPSEKMLDGARSRDQRVNWLWGSAEQLPAADDMFDGAIATLTVHHWTDIKKAFREIFRVLKNGARLVIFTADPEQMKGYWLNHYFPKMLADSISQMPTFDTIADAAIDAGFIITATEKYFIPDDLQDHFLYSGKNKPELYLDEGIRKGISSFSALANTDEVQQGLFALESDISLGKFEEVKAKFNNGLGDYLFIIAEKE